MSAHHRHGDEGADVAAMIPVYSTLMCPGALDSAHTANRRDVLWQSYQELLKPLAEYGQDAEDGGLLGGFR